MSGEQLTCHDVVKEGVLQDLVQAAYGGLVINEYGAFHTSLTMALPDDAKWSRDGYNGDFGILLLHTESAERAAVSGFNLIRYLDGIGILINHMPQGAPRGVLSRPVRREFLPYENFRDDMLQNMIEVVTRFGLISIEIVSAGNHYKVRSEQLPLDKAYQIIDDVALRNGFEYCRGGNLILRK